MAKFYVQSGSLRGVVDCFDEECAAVWAIHRAMQRLPHINSVDSLTPEEEIELGEAMFELDDTIWINERGFDRDDSVEIDLHAAFLQWHQLKKAIDAISKNWDEPRTLDEQLDE